MFLISLLKPIYLAALAVVASCVFLSTGWAQSSLPVAPNSWIGTPKNADECLLRALPGTTSDVAAQQITSACHRLYPTIARPAPRPSQPIVQPSPPQSSGREQKLRPLDRRKIVLNGNPAFSDQGDKYLARLFFGNNNNDIYVTRIELELQDRRFPQESYQTQVKLAPGGTAEGHIWLPKKDLSQVQFKITGAWGIPILR